jgi:hypothetical protein
MRAVITIDMDSEAFVDQAGRQVARILDKVVKQVRDEATLPKKLYDINGNAVGSCRIRL